MKITLRGCNGKNARWFELETPNLDSPFVVGKMNAGIR